MDLFRIRNVKDNALRIEKAIIGELLQIIYGDMIYILMSAAVSNIFEFITYLLELNILEIKFPYKLFDRNSDSVVYFLLV